MRYRPKAILVGHSSLSTRFLSSTGKTGKWGMSRESGRDGRAPSDLIY